MACEARSGNEIAALVLKASRGAGLPMGCAQDVSRAAAALARCGALPDLAAVLALPPEPAVRTGACISGGHPVLALIAWIDLRAAGHDVALTAPCPELVRRAMMAAAGQDGGAALAGPFEVDAATWGALNRLAERTFVPESAQSRGTGAGGGADAPD